MQSNFGLYKIKWTRLATSQVIPFTNPPHSLYFAGCVPPSAPSCINTDYIFAETGQEAVEKLKYYALGRYYNGLGMLSNQMPTNFINIVSVDFVFKWQPSTSDMPTPSPKQ